MRDDLRLSREVHGDVHEDTLISLNNLAHLLVLSKQPAEAEALLIESLFISRDMYGRVSIGALEATSKVPVFGRCLDRTLFRKCQ